MYKIIFIDDEISVLRVLPHIINWEKYDIEISGTASDAAKGLTLYERVKPDIIITDIKMPDINGLEFSRMIREKDTRVKIILLSAYGEFEFAKTALQYKINDYLLKPLDEKELEVIIERILKQIHNEEAHFNEINKNNIDKNPSYIVITKAKEFIKSNYTRKDISLQEVAQYVGFSKNHFSRLFHEYTGETLWEYLTNYRLEQARDLLQKTNLTNYEICNKIGYESVYHFCRKFKEDTGMSPQKFRKG